MSIPEIGIIGGGASGALLAIQLLRQGHAKANVTIYEPREQLARGIAYSTASDLHPLNVPAGNMSALADDPTHFLNWLNAHHSPNTPPFTFASRHRYAEYLQWLLTHTQGPLRHVCSRVIGLNLAGGKLHIQTESGQTEPYNKVVLALGHGPAANPLPKNSSAQAVSAWSPGVLDGLSSDSSVALIGSGLTAIDICLSLNERSHTGPVTIISRHGLLPRSHLTGPAAPMHPPFSYPLPNSPLELLRLIRSRAHEELGTGRSWQAVIDALRPFTNELWAGFSVNEKRQFMRRLRCYWDVVRHRMPHETAREIAALQASGQLTVLGGKLIAAHVCNDGSTHIEVLQAHRRSNTQVFARRIINCTGPHTNPLRSTDPLIRHMLTTGLVRTDPLSIGLETSADGSLIGRNGRATVGLYAIGPSRKGTLWETIAIPEIRGQARVLAAQLLFPV